MTAEYLSRASYEIPCLHDLEDVSDQEEVSDYYPLTKEDVAQLVSIAFSTQNRRIRADIQNRLIQGIVGVTCPQPDDEGPIDRAIAELSEYYVKNLSYYGADPIFAETLYEIMQSPGQAEQEDD